MRTSLEVGVGIDCLGKRGSGSAPVIPATAYDTDNFDGNFLDRSASVPPNSNTTFRCWIKLDASRGTYCCIYGIITTTTDESIFFGVGSDGTTPYVYLGVGEIYADDTERSEISRGIILS